MHNYIFMSLFFCLFVFMSRHKGISFVLFLAYVVYIFFVNEVDNNKLYYLMLTALDTSVGLYVMSIYHEKGCKTARTVAYLAFLAAIVHMYGRLVHGFELDSDAYNFVCMSIVLAQFLVIVSGRLIDGIFRNSDRGCSIRPYNNFNKKFNIARKAESSIN